MAEQNILEGDIVVLEEIIANISEHSNAVSKRRRLSDMSKELSNNIEAAEKDIENEIAAKLKEGMDSVSEGYNKSILEEQKKLKEVQSQRDKAKIAGVRKRIDKETVALRDNNEALKGKIKNLYRNEGIPAFCSKKLFFSIFCGNGLMDGLLYFVLLSIVYAVIPGALWLIKTMPKVVYIVYYFVLIVIHSFLSRLIYSKVVIPHMDTIVEVRDLKLDIKSNSKKIKRIEHGIKSDKNEDMYGLDSYDSKIKEINQSIANIENKKTMALKDFESFTKQDIVTDIQSRHRDRIEAIRAELVKTNSDMENLDSLIKDQRAYISTNYEAYLGKEFMSIEKLKELAAIMKTREAKSIAHAIALYRESH